MFFPQQRPHNALVDYANKFDNVFVSLLFLFDADDYEFSKTRYS